MPKETIKQTVLKYLSTQFIFGGTIERDVSSMHQCKTSNVGRRLRELETEGKIEKNYTQVNGKGPHVVQYRLNKIEDSLLHSICPIPPFPSIKKNPVNLSLSFNQ